MGRRRRFGAGGWFHKEWLGPNRKPGETQILDRLRKAGFVESA